MLRLLKQIGSDLEDIVTQLDGNWDRRKPWQVWVPLIGFVLYLTACGDPVGPIGGGPPPPDDPPVVEPPPDPPAPNPRAWAPWAGTYRVTDVTPGTNLVAADSANTLVLKIVHDQGREGAAYATTAGDLWLVAPGGNTFSWLADRHLDGDYLVVVDGTVVSYFVHNGAPHPLDPYIWDTFRDGVITLISPDGTWVVTFTREDR